MTYEQSKSELSGPLIPWKHDGSGWIADEDWMQCNAIVAENVLVGRECSLGIDVSDTGITAVTACFPPKKAGGHYRFIYRFFLPEKGLVEREWQDELPYAYWVARGYLILMPGWTINYDRVEQEIINLAGKFEIVDAAYFKSQAANMVENLESADIAMVRMDHSYQHMAAPTKEFQQLVLRRRIAHGGHPVMRRMIFSTEVKPDRQGNIIPEKPGRDSRGSIGGVTASIIALDRALRHGKSGHPKAKHMVTVNMSFSVPQRKLGKIIRAALKESS